MEGEPLARVMEEQGTRRHAARGGEQGHSSRMAATHGHASCVGAFPRTAGERWSGHGGKPIWAVSGANWTLGLK